MDFKKWLETDQMDPFNIPPKPKKMGKNSKAIRMKIEEYLISNGLMKLRTGGRDVYYGVASNQGPRTAEGRVIKLQTQAFKMVRRYRSGGAIQEINVRSYPYGHVTEEILDIAINWVVTTSQEY